jgi:hypothetical protein
MDNDGFIFMGSHDAGAPSCMDWDVNAALAVGNKWEHVAVRLETTWDASWGMVLRRRERDATALG